jgi:hypothetical protein
MIKLRLSLREASATKQSQEFRFFYETFNKPMSLLRFARNDGKRFALLFRNPYPIREPLGTSVRAHFPVKDVFASLPIVGIGIGDGWTNSLPIL